MPQIGRSTIDSPGFRHFKGWKEGRKRWRKKKWPRETFDGICGKISLWYLVWMTIWKLDQSTVQYILYWISSKLNVPPQLAQYCQQETTDCATLWSPAYGAHQKSFFFSPFTVACADGHLPKANLVFPGTAQQHPGSTCTDASLQIVFPHTLNNAHSFGACLWREVQGGERERFKINEIFASTRLGRRAINNENIMIKRCIEIFSFCSATKGDLFSPYSLTIDVFTGIWKEEKKGRKKHTSEAYRVGPIGWIRIASTFGVEQISEKFRL